MLLSMRMILNLMGNFSVHSEINDETDTANLMSVRMAYAPNCLQISAHGTGVLCRGNADNRFILEDISLLEGFEIIQGIFDYYNNWESHIRNLAADRKFQEIIDNCHLIFRNPVSLMDGNYQVLACSSAYGEEDVDEEWKYLKRMGCLSVDTMKRMKRQGQMINAGLLDEPHITPAIGTRLLRMANVKMYWNNEFCGRLVVREKDRPINAGDLRVMKTLQTVIAPNLAKSSPNTPYSSKDVFSEIITTGRVDRYLLEKSLAYLQWSNVQDFRLLLIRMAEDYKDDMILHQLRRTILKIFPFCSVNIIDDSLAVIVQKEDVVDNLAELMLDDLMLRGKARIGVSLPVKDLSQLRHYYMQLRYAMEQSESPMDTVVYAFDSMISYLICSSRTDGAVCACHPDVLHLLQVDRRESTDYLKLLKTYLDSERNISGTAKALFMHRNTLVYRLEKLSTLLNADLDDPYERNYLRLSIYVLEACKELPL